MLIDIDISLLTPNTAVGRIYGALEFPCLPRIGELVSLRVATSTEAGFDDQLTVEHVIHSPGANSRPMLSLSDLVANDVAHAKLLGEAFEVAYGLFFEQYDLGSLRP